MILLTAAVSLLRRISAFESSSWLICWKPRARVFRSPWRFFPSLLDIGGKGGAFWRDWQLGLGGAEEMDMAERDSLRRLVLDIM